MKNRKEYSDRNNATLVNPPITFGDWQEQQAAEGFKSYLDKYGSIGSCEHRYYGPCKYCDLEFQQACGE